MPTFLSLKVAVPLTVMTSPETRLSAYVTVAAVVPSYVLFDGVIVTLSVRGVIDAYVIGELFTDTA